MVNATRGVLVTWYFLGKIRNFPSDPAIKQFILYLDVQHHFGLIDLDETHLFLYNADQTIMDMIQKELDKLQEENTYQENPETRDKLFRIQS